jgi:hypothetical protein
MEVLCLRVGKVVDKPDGERACHRGNDGDDHEGPDEVAAGGHRRYPGPNEVTG